MQQHNIDPFLLTLPSFSNQSLTLTIEENLSGFAGQSFSIEVEERESGTDTVLNTYTIEIEILDDSTNTIDNITVRENQLGQIFDPADVYVPGRGNNTIIINFEESILKNTFDDRNDELDYGNTNHRNAHVIFGDTGFLLDPYYNSKITVYEDAVPDLI